MRQGLFLFAGNQTATLVADSPGCAVRLAGPMRRLDRAGQRVVQSVDLLFRHIYPGQRL